MRRLLSLAHLTALDLSPPALIALAARIGFDRAGLRLLPAAPGGIAHRLMDDPAGVRATRAAIADTRVGVFDLEIIRIDEAFDATAYEAFFAVGAELGAKAVLVAGDDPDEARTVANFAALCDVAAPYGLTCDLEFMPWTAVADARAALRVVAAADRPNGGVLVDALHFARSKTTLADLAMLPPVRLHYVQICDAPAAIPATVEGMIHDARCERLLPGDGGIDLAGLLAQLPDDLPISCEVPNDVRRADMGTEAWARAVFEAAKRVVGIRRAE